MSQTAIFYVYEHWRPDTGLPFYVGKGKGGRAALLGRRGLHHANLVAKLARSGLGVEIRKVFTGLDEEMAFTLEKSQISYWQERGVSLLNRTKGGDGVSGFRFTPEQRAQMSASRMGNQNTLGHKNSEETRAKKRRSALLRHHPPEEVDELMKLPYQSRGNRRKPEGIPHGNSGKPLSPERREKIRQSHLARIERIKNESEES